METIGGSCHCGTIRWELRLPVKTVLRCHCSNCRKLQGADYSTWIVAQPSSVKLTTGAERLTEYTPGRSGKSFCSVCGSTVLLNNGKHFPGDVILALGGLDGYTETLAPQVEVYTEDKAPWVSLHQG